MKKDRKVVVEINISALVPVTSNDGGYYGRRCLVCGAHGFERSSDYGYHHAAKMDDDWKSPGYHMSNDITHKRSCVLNQYIDKKTGRLL
jgi:hypothetical protein